MPMSTPAASNKAITLMTSPVAICGSGFSTGKTHAHTQTPVKLQTNIFHSFQFALFINSNDPKTPGKRTYDADLHRA